MITQERSFMNFLKFDKEYEYLGTEKLLEMFTQNEIHQMKITIKTPTKLFKGEVDKEEIRQLLEGKLERARPELFCNQIFNDDQSILRVTSGASPRTPAWFKRNRASVYEWMREGHWYPDSFVQYILFESKALEDERKNLKSEIFDEFPIHYVTSVQQARTLISNKAKIMTWKDEDKLQILLKIQANEEHITLEELETFYPLLNKENIARFYDVDVNCTGANRYTNWKEVLDSDLNVLHVITSENARELYEECIVTFQFLKEINISSKKLNCFCQLVLRNVRIEEHQY